MLSIEKYIEVYGFCSLLPSDLMKSFKIQFTEPSPLTSTVFYVIHWLTLAKNWMLT